MQRIAQRWGVNLRENTYNCKLVTILSAVLDQACFRDLSCPLYAKDYKHHNSFQYACLFIHLCMPESHF